jgi:hypothetical protein
MNPSIALLAGVGAAGAAGAAALARADRRKEAREARAKRLADPDGLVGIAGDYLIEGRDQMTRLDQEATEADAKGERAEVIVEKLKGANPKITVGRTVLTAVLGAIAIGLILTQVNLDATSIAALGVSPTIAQLYALIIPAVAMALGAVFWALCGVHSELLPWGGRLSTWTRRAAAYAIAAMLVLGAVFGAAPLAEHRSEAGPQKAVAQDELALQQARDDGATPAIITKLTTTLSQDKEALSAARTTDGVIGGTAPLAEGALSPFAVGSVELASVAAAAAVARRHRRHGERARAHRAELSRTLPDTVSNTVAAIAEVSVLTAGEATNEATRRIVALDAERAAAAGATGGTSPSPNTGTTSAPIPGGTAKPATATPATATNATPPKATNTTPVYTSPNTATFTVGTPGTFRITTEGGSGVTLSAGWLPAGLSFTDRGDGTATISGTPSVPSTDGPIPVEIRANVGLPTGPIRQSLAITVAGSAGPERRPGVR